MCCSVFFEFLNLKFDVLNVTWKISANQLSQMLLLYNFLSSIIETLVNSYMVVTVNVRKMDEKSISKENLKL